MSGRIWIRDAWILCITAMLAACVQSPDNQNDPEDTNAHNRARVHTELASAYYGAGQYDIALDEVRIALEADDDYLQAINQLGLIHIALGQTEEAKKALKHAIKVAPDDPSVNNNYGMLLCSLGDQAEAMRYFKKALNDPLYRNPEFAYVNAGVCVKDMGDYERARQLLGRALALSPDQPQALYHMADVAYLTGDYRSARRYITRHLQVVVAGPDALWLAARTAYQLGDAGALDTYGVQLNRRFPDLEQTRAFNGGRF